MVKYIIDYLCLKDIKQLNKGLTLEERKMLTIHLNGEKIIVPHQRGYGNYTIQKIGEKSVMETYFTIDGEQISIPQYYWLKYNYKIKFEYLPCIIDTNDIILKKMIKYYPFHLLNFLKYC